MTTMPPLSTTPPGDVGRRQTTSGFTLVELVVVLVILGLLTAVVAVSAATLSPPAAATVPQRVAEARAQAVTTGASVTVTFGGGVTITLRPDGSATPATIHDGEITWMVDPWTAEVRRAD